MIFLEPLNLLFLLLPILFLYLSFKNTKISANKIFSKHVLQKITLYPDLENKSNHYRLFLIAMSLFIISLAQPIFNSKHTSNQFRFTPLVLALDISKSMSLTDIYPNRLTFAKKKIYSILEMNPKFRVAFLLFSRDSYLAYPMSEDFDSLKYILSNINQKFESGSNLFAALEGSKQILRRYSSKNILLLSDGTSSDNFKEEEQYLKDNNITLNAIYINKNSLKKEKLKSLCISSGGVFKEFSFGSKDIEFLLNSIQKHSQTKELNKKTLKAKNQIQLFYYPLFLALILILFIFLKKYDFKRIRHILFIVIFFSFSSSQIRLTAGILEFKRIKDAKEFYEKKEYKKAIKIYERLTQNRATRYNLANSLYKNKEYKRAIEEYKLSLFKNNHDTNAKIYYNIANAYFYLRKLHSAKKYYIKSLKIKNDKMAQDNLEALLNIIKILKDKKSNKKNDYLLPKTMSSYTKDLPEPMDSGYTVKLKKMVLNKEDKWMNFIENEKPTIFLQKLNTKRMSKNAKRDD